MKQNWFDANPKKAKLLVVVICLVFVEIAVRAFVWLDLLPYTRYPTTGSAKFGTKSETVVGLWHLPDVSVDTKGCFGTRYESNAYGARDRERAPRLSGEKRFVVLGDSLVEGLGVQYGRRVTEVLEEETGIEHMNVASSGWGTIQAWLYYENYMLDFDHTGVILFIFPANDFKENNPDLNGKGNYKPFLRDIGDRKEVFYPVAYEDRDRGGRPWHSVVKNTIDNSSYIANLLRYALRMTKVEARKQQNKNSYDDFSDRDLEVFLYALNQLAEATGDRPLYLVTIPMLEDLNFARESGYEFRLIKELKKFSGRHAGVELIDLLPYTVRYLDEHDLSFSDLSLGCDWHWGELGNRVAAEAIIERIYVAD